MVLFNRVPAVGLCSAGLKVTLLAVVLVTLLPLATSRAQSAFTGGGASVTTSAAAAMQPSAGKPLVHLGTPELLDLTYTGPSEAVSSLSGETANPTALATADFNADGAPDVVAGYSTKDGGVLTVVLGNPDAFAPKDTSLFMNAMQGDVPATFLPVAVAYSLPASPDLIVIGDFNRDGNRDVLVAARGGWLYLLAGDGTGKLGAPRLVPLGGAVSAMAATSDGHLAVSIDGGHGMELVILAPGPEGLHSIAAYPLPAQGNAVLWSDLGGGMDVAVGADSHIAIVYNALKENPQTETVDLSFNVKGLTAGSFIWDRDGRSEIAVLAEDGSIHILQHGSLDTRPLTAADASGRRAALREQRKQERLNPMSLGVWTEAKEVRNPGSAPGGTLSQTAFSSPHLAASSTNDLMVLEAEGSQLHILDTSGKAAAPSATVSFSGSPVAAIALPQRIDAHRETIVLVKGVSHLVAIDQGTDPTYNVTTTADVDSVGACAANSTVTTSNPPLSLREAICEVNNKGAGTYTINVPAGTYSLTTSTFGGNGSAYSGGELQVGMSSSATITISGAGAGTTIIKQTNGVDRVIEQDELGIGGIPLTIQNLTLTGGNCSTGIDCGFSGGALLAGGYGGDALTLNSVVVSNSSELADTPALGGGNQGGGVSMAGPDLIITNSTFSGNSVSASSTNAGVGGGVEFLDDIAGSVTITGSTFTNNTVAASSPVSGQGGGLWISLNVNGDQAAITGSTFTGNKVAGSNGQGGGIFTAGPTTISNSRITGNTAAGGGGGFWEQGSVTSAADGTGTVTNNWWGCNTGPNTSGCDTEAASGVSGDNASVVFNPWLVLSISANPTAIQTNATSTLTAGITKNSSGTGGFTVPNGTNVAFGDTLGSVNPGSTTLTSGVATSTFTAGSTSGTGSGTATVDNQTVSVNIDILAPPTISKSFGASSILLNGSTSLSFTITNPNAGAGLTGVAFSDDFPTGLAVPSSPNVSNNCGGTVTAPGGSGSLGLSGGTVSASGSCTLSVSVTGIASGVQNNTTGAISSTNGGTGSTSNTATLTVDQAPSFTSASGATFTVGSQASFAVTALGFPAPTFSESGALPNGDTLSTSGALSGTPAAGTGGRYTITITASNGIGAAATQSFTLTIDQAPSITSAGNTTFVGGTAGTFTVTTTGYPTSALSESGALPGTVMFTDNGNGTATLAGIAPAAGLFPITITAKNGVSPNASQNFTLTVTEYALTTVANPATGGTITPASGSLFNPGTVVPIVATPAAGFTFVGWTSAADPVASASTASTTITMNGPESITAQFAPNLVVTTNQDDAGTATNCTPQTTPGTGTDSACSLRDALLNAAGAGAGNISFSGSAFNAGTTATNTITLSNGTLAIPSNTSISGATSGSGSSVANLVTVNGNAASSVFTVNSGVTGASLSSLTITNGKASSGGGINNGGTLTVTSSTISGNATSGSGAGVFNAGTLRLTGSTLSGNAAQGTFGGGTGGGISSTGTLTVSNCTISGNSATGEASGVGGGIAINSGSATVGSTTISSNSSDGSGGGIYAVGGVPAVLGYDIVSGNSSSSNADVSGPITNDGGNLIGVSGINLAPLDLYGGPTKTMVPMPGSAAICGAQLGDGTLVPNLTTDQRGNPLDSLCPSGFVDTGALQTNYALAFTTEPPSNTAVGVPVSPAPVLTLTESGAVFAPASSTVNITDADSALSGGTNSAAVSSGTATFGNLIFSALEGSDTLTASLSLNSNLTPALNLVSASSTDVYVGSLATLTTPTPGLSTVLGTNNVLFQWSGGTGDALYQLTLSAVEPGGSDLFSFKGTATSATVLTLPANGVTVYARLSSKINGTWFDNDYLYTESGTPVPAILQSPSPGVGTVLGTSNVLFQWSSGTGVTLYQLSLSTIAPGDSDLYSYKGTATSATVLSLPSNGVIVYATLYSYINGAWRSNSYVYTESGTSVPAILQSPAPGLTTVLGTSSVHFQWTAGTGVTLYQLNLSAVAPGDSDLFLYKGSATTATASSLPANGITIYARLYSYINKAWQYNDYVYTESGTSVPAILQSPSPGLSTVLGTSSVLFQWTAGTGVTLYQLNLSAVAPGDSELFLYKGTATSATAPTMPANGVTVYARLYSNIDGVWQYNDYVYTEQ